MDVWYSRLFNVHAWSEHKQIADLVDEVFESLSQEEQQQLTGASRNKGKTDLKKHLRLGSGLIKLDPEPDGCQFYHRQEVA